MQPMVAAFGPVRAFMNSGIGGRMSTAVPQTRFLGIARLVTLSAFLALPVCAVSQDKRQTNASNAGSDEEIKQLISMYAKAAHQADPALASRVWCDSSEDSLIKPVGR
jgi:hypothetical protein